MDIFNFIYLYSHQRYLVIVLVVYLLDTWDINKSVLFCAVEGMYGTLLYIAFLTH